MDFIIDTQGETSKNDTKTSKGSHEDCIMELLRDYQDTLVQRQPEKKSKKEDLLIKELLEDLGWNVKKNRKPENIASEDRSIEVKQALSKSVLLRPDFEKLHAVPPLEISERKLKEERKKDGQKTKGKKWFGLPATELTEEVKNDLEILKMRSVLDPKRFYKKNDLNVLPKYFQIGKVMDSPLDFYNNRSVKKQGKKTLVEELLADAEFNKYNKRKYKEIIEEKQKTHYKAWKQAKKLKKKK